MNFEIVEYINYRSMEQDTLIHHVGEGFDRNHESPKDVYGFPGFPIAETGSPELPDSLRPGLVFPDSLRPGLVFPDSRIP